MPLGTSFLPAQRKDAKMRYQVSANPLLAVLGGNTLTLHFVDRVTKVEPVTPENNNFLVFSCLINCNTLVLLLSSASSLQKNYLFSGRRISLCHLFLKGEA